MVTLGQIVVWVLVGALAGSLAAMLVRRSRWGFGRLGNILLGMVGAVLGGFLFDVLNINLGLGQITFSFEDLFAAFIGSILILILLRYIR